MPRTQKGYDTLALSYLLTLTVKKNNETFQCDILTDFKKSRNLSCPKPPFPVTVEAASPSNCVVLKSKNFKVRFDQKARLFLLLKVVIFMCENSLDFSCYFMYEIETCFDFFRVPSSCKS